MSEIYPEDDSTATALAGDPDDCQAPQGEPDAIKIDPMEYLVFSNPDKKNRRRLGPYRYMPLSTARILLSGLPGVGKRNLILNIVHKMKPLPSAIHIVHIDQLTHEYDQLVELGVPVYIYMPEDFPTMANIENPDEETVQPTGEHGPAEEASQEAVDEPKGSPLVIVDEVTTDQLGREGAHKFERMVNYVCTHRDTTLMCSIQSLLNIPAKVRRSFNQFALWRQNDINLNRIVAQRIGAEQEFLDMLFQLCQNRYEFIYIDTDEWVESPWRYRLNWIYPITIKNVAPEEKEPSETV